MNIKRFIRKFGSPQTIFSDFDGCLTNDQVHVDSNGHEFVSANRKDGLALNQLQHMGIPIIIVSKEKNKVVTARGNKIGVKVVQGIDDKKNEVLNFAITEKLDLSKCWFIGNDRNDIEVMRIVGLSICPNDAVDTVQKIADQKLKTKGGNGIFSEILIEIEKSLRNQVFKIRKRPN